MKKLVLILCALTIALIPAQQPMMVTLAWDQNSENNLAGYRIFYRQGTNAETIITNVYNPNIPAGKAVTQPIYLGTPTAVYTFEVTAYNTVGLESARSAQVSYATPAVQPNKVGDPDILILP